MSIIEPTSYNASIPNEVINGDQQVLNQVRNSNTGGKEQLKKVAKEFESLFISKMFTLLDQTVDKEDGVFGEETKYYDTMKSYMYNELGRNLASNPHTTFGFAKQIYEQMERYVKD